MMHALRRSSAREYVTAMGKPPVAAYFQECRKGARLTQQNVADALGVDLRTVQYWEAGSEDPSFDNLMRYCQVIKADVREVQRLWLEGTPLAVNERGRAAVWRQIAAQFSDAELDEAIEVLELHERLRSRPKLLGRWMEYGERLDAEIAPAGGQ